MAQQVLDWDKADAEAAKSRGVSASTDHTTPNNNPGGLKFAHQKGAVDDGSGYAKFETPEAGYQALVNQVKLDQGTGRGHTVRSYVEKYAPPKNKEGKAENNTEEYIKQFSNALGVTPDTPLASIDTEKIAAFQAQKESGTKTPTSAKLDPWEEADKAAMTSRQYGGKPTNESRGILGNLWDAVTGAPVDTLTKVGEPLEGKSYNGVSTPSTGILNSTNKFGNTIANDLYSLPKAIWKGGDPANGLLDSVKEYLSKPGQTLQKGIESLRAGHLSEALGYAGGSLANVAGMDPAGAGETIGSGDIAGGLGHSAVAVGTAALPMVPEAFRRTSDWTADTLRRNAEVQAMRGQGGGTNPSIGADTGPIRAEMVRRGVGTDKDIIQGRQDAGSRVEAATDRVPISRMVNRDAIMSDVRSMRDALIDKEGNILDPITYSEANKTLTELAKKPAEIPYHDYNQYFRGKDSYFDKIGGFDSTGAKANAGQAVLAPLRAARAEVGGTEVQAANSDFHYYDTLSDIVMKKRPELSLLKTWDDKLAGVQNKPVSINPRDYASTLAAGLGAAGVAYELGHDPTLAGTVGMGVDLARKAGNSPTISRTRANFQGSLASTIDRFSNRIPKATSVPQPKYGVFPEGQPTNILAVPPTPPPAFNPGAHLTPKPEVPVAPPDWNTNSLRGLGEGLNYSHLRTGDNTVNPFSAEGQAAAAKAASDANTNNTAAPLPNLGTAPQAAALGADIKAQGTPPVVARPPAPELRLPGSDTGTLVGRQRTAEGNTSISPIEALTRPNAQQALYGPPPEVPDNIKTPKKAAKSIVDDLKEKAAKEAEKAKAKKAPKKK